jgi:tRNA (adenine57-N1/adenine58-N1)-methyltransferase
MALPQGSTVQYGNIVMLVDQDGKTLLRTARPGARLQTRYGEVNFDALIGLPYGTPFKTHLGHAMLVLTPSLDDVFTHIKRETQIIYPKDLGYIALKLGLRQGVQAIEAGSGSGALTALLALMVGDAGHVYSYERRPGNIQQARQNVKRLDLDHRVTFIERDIQTGFDQAGVHALFLDLPNPQAYLDIAWKALQLGGFFGAIVPTVNQLMDLLATLYRGPWGMVQAEELLLRRWKTLPARIRPDEEMYGHTGFLVFARAVQRQSDSASSDNSDYNQGTLSG